MIDFSPLTDELDCWHRAGLTARVWLRDDDASDATDALARLTEQSDRFGVPMLLAVIPQPATTALRDAVLAHPGLSVAVHGFRHQNHATPGQKSIELGGERPIEGILAELRCSRRRLSELFGDKLTDILVPPWNRIRPDCVTRLGELGFTCLSTFGAASEATGTSGLKQLNTHLDIIDWKGSRGGRDPDWLVGELVRLLRQARQAGGRSAIGVLTHHLDHDQLAWAFLEGLFATTTARSDIYWVSATEL